MKHKERSAFLLHHTDMQVACRCLDDTQLGLLLRMLYHHSIGEQVEEDALPIQVLPLYMLFSDKITRDAIHYEETCARQRRNVEKRWQKQQEEENNDTTVYHGIPNIPNTNTKAEAVTNTKGKSKADADAHTNASASAKTQTNEQTPQSYEIPFHTGEDFQDWRERQIEAITEFNRNLREAAKAKKQNAC